MRRSLLVLSALLIAAPAAAQQAANPDPDDVVASGGAFPEGWTARVDRDQPIDRVSFRSMGEGFHATMGPAAVFYNPQMSKSGDYKVAARFRQTRAPAHPEAYGLMIGAADMTGADQRYSYFLVRKDGRFYIATRRGAEVTKVVDWTAHDAVQKEQANGSQVNVLGAEVRGNEVIFTVNDTEVARRPKGEVLTDGYWGFRVNHNLDVHIDPLTR